MHVWSKLFPPSIISLLYSFLDFTFRRGWKCTFSFTILLTYLELSSLAQRSSCIPVLSYKSWKLPLFALMFPSVGVDVLVFLSFVCSHSSFVRSSCIPVLSYTFSFWLLASSSALLLFNSFLCSLCSVTLVFSSVFSSLTSTYFSRLVRTSSGDQKRVPFRRDVD